MFFLIEFFLLIFSLVSFFLFFVRGRKFLLSLFFSMPAFLTANAAAFLVFYGAAQSTPLVTFTKLSHFGKWQIFSLAFVAVFLVVLVIFGLLVLLLRPTFSLAEKKQNAGQNIAWTLLAATSFFLSFLFLYSTVWSKGRFPMDTTDTVFYTLSGESGGMDQRILLEAKLLIALEALSAVFVVAFGLCLPILAHSNSVTFFYYSVNKSRQQQEAQRLQKKIFARQVSVPAAKFLLVVSLIFLAASGIWTAVALHFGSYGKLVALNLGKVRKSDFIDKEFVQPVYENIKFPEKKKNLIFIFAESLESSYASVESGGVFPENNIPLLTEIAAENLSFSHGEALGGGKDVPGTRWTVAAMLAKFGGVPYNLPLSSKKDEFFLPDAVTLTDILAHNGYRQRFVFGSKKHFARRDKLLETHGGVEIHDIDWYKKNGLLPEDYQVFWGFEDAKLFDFVKLELSDLAANKEATGEPFMLGFLTVDTHMPSGFVCPLCSGEDGWQMKNVIRCADRQLSSFLDWAKTQSWYADTAIVIVGDHLFMTGDNTNFFDNLSLAEIASGKRGGFPQNPDLERRWLNIFINAAPRKIGGNDASGKLAEEFLGGSEKAFENGIDANNGNHAENGNLAKRIFNESQKKFIENGIIAESGNTENFRENGENISENSSGSAAEKFSEQKSSGAFSDFDGDEVFSNRQFCSFDIFPTTLSALGCEIKGDRLAFGTDLFSGQKTLCERYDDETIGFETMRKKW